MDKFIMKKSTEANIYKSIRFPVEINDAINNIVQKANEGKNKKEYRSMNYICFMFQTAFVISACEYALNHMK